MSSLYPMPHRSVLALLIALPLAAASPELRLDLRTTLGTDPSTEITLIPPGIWDGLLLAARAPVQHSGRQGIAEATVEVSDFALRTSAREVSFALYLQDLRKRLLRGFQLPPPSHGKIELAEFVGSDPTRPQDLELTRVQSLQERFNRLPPSGSPVERK
jgi:hypothetical protein